jgi:hypothetical protein
MYLWQLMEIQFVFRFHRLTDHPVYSAEFQLSIWLLSIFIWTSDSRLLSFRFYNEKTTHMLGWLTNKLLYNHILMSLSIISSDINACRNIYNLSLQDVVGNWIDGPNVQFGRSRFHHSLIHFRSEVLPIFTLTERNSYFNK